MTCSDWITFGAAFIIMIAIWLGLCYWKMWYEEKAGRKEPVAIIINITIPIIVIALILIIMTMFLKLSTDDKIQEDNFVTVLLTMIRLGYKPTDLFANIILTISFLLGPVLASLITIVIFRLIDFEPS